MFSIMVFFFFCMNNTQDFIYDCVFAWLLNVVLYSLQDNPEETEMFNLSLSHIGRYFCVCCGLCNVFIVMIHQRRQK